jgi:hypothetical protein
LVTAASNGLAFSSAYLNERFSGHIVIKTDQVSGFAVVKARIVPKTVFLRNDSSGRMYCPSNVFL